MASGREPKTMKVHAIIEKTALFVSKQGAQMEIILKTKQKDNQQFEFLNYEHELNPYYKNLVSAIKQGKYVPVAPQPEPEEHDDSHSYLHPSLTSSSEPKEPEAAPMTSQEFLESIQSKLPAGQIANTPYAKLLSNLRKHAVVVAPVPAPEQIAHHDIRQQTVSSASASPVETYDDENPAETRQSGKKKRTKESIDHLQHSNGEKRQKKDLVHGPLIIPPPPDQQPIIDKMADYVARNGPEFEIVVKMKNDERFRFLEPDHIHYNYYQYKKNIFIQDMENQKLEVEKAKQKEKVESETREKLENNSESDTNGSGKENDKDDAVDKMNTNKGVSFSIKPKEEETSSLKTRTALLYESTDDEDDDGQLSSKGSHTESDAASISAKPPSRNLSRASLVAEKQPGNQDDAEKKQAEQKLLDKLAAAARDKLARASRERQLQAQRKRKAAMFVNMLKDIDSTVTGSAPNPAVTAVASDGLLAGSLDSPFSSQVPSRSMTPTTFLDHTAVITSSAAIPSVSTTKPVSHDPSTSRSYVSRKRSRSRSRNRSKTPPKRHRKRSKTPPNAYTVSRRSASKSPARHRSRSHSHSRSKHKSKHPRAHSRSRSDSKAKRKDADHKVESKSRSHERKSKKDSESKSHKSSRKSSHKKKLSKDREPSRHHKSRKHKSKSKHRKSESSSESDVDEQFSSKRPCVSSSVSRVNPDFVDLTIGSPRDEEESGRKQDHKVASSASDDIVPHVEMLTNAHALWKAKRAAEGKI